MRSPLILILIVFLLTGCQSSQKPSTENDQNNEQKSIGSLEVLSDEIHEVISWDAQVELLAEGFKWSEGPVWVEELDALLFSDVPENIIYKWSEAEGLTKFLEPSGNTGIAPTNGGEGSNGLALDAEGNLLICQHGDRRIARVEKPLSQPGQFRTIVDQMGSMRFNSPNDLAVKSNGDIYFTDPPYGLADHDKDLLKEINYNGVYKFSSGKVEVIDSTLSRPNGIAFSPDESILYVANSDPEHAIWMVYDLAENSKKIFFDATSMVSERIGLPDGLKVNRKGVVFASGPGGVLIFKPDGTHLGTILTKEATSNCAISPDEKYLYMTTDSFLTRIALR